MVDLGISRTQDIQNPLAANKPLSRISSEAQDREARPQPLKPARRNTEAQADKGPADLEGEVRRLNDLLGSSTQIRFVINRTNNDVYVEVVDKESNKVLKTIPPSDLPAVAGKLIEGGVLVDNRS
jgi:flagellar protein FlaG